MRDRKVLIFALAALVLVGAGAGLLAWRSMAARGRSRALANQAMALLERRPLSESELAAAGRLAAQAEELDPTSGRPAFVLGIIALEQQRSMEAVEYLSESVARDPEDLAVRPFLAELLVNLGEPAEAQVHLEAHLRRAPDDVASRGLLAECYRQQHRPAAARRELLGVLARRGEDRRARWALARLELEEGDFAAAARHARALVQRDASDREARALLELAERRKQRGGHESDGAGQDDSERPAIASVRFTEVAESLGVRFHHANGESPHRYLPELLGSGVAVFDYDGDGWVDLYFVNGTMLPVDESGDGPRNTLYRNRGDGTFEDRTDASGLGHRGFGTGVAVGDYDNDGLPDLYVTCYGANVLLRNNGDGSFGDVTAQAAVGDTGMGTGAAWLDADEDGDLDLYVVNYAQYDLAHPLECTHPKVGKIYCGVQQLTASPDVFYANQGDGTFEVATVRAGVARRDGKGMGVAAADVDGDGHVDLYVANDTTPNFLYLGTGGLRFSDATGTSGAASNRDGEEQGSMGVAVGDLNGDGLPELFTTNYWMEHNALYRNLGGLFHDVADRTGVGVRSRQAVGWGTVFEDFNNDGALDLFVANGHFYDWRGWQEPLEQLPELWLGRPPREVPRQVAGEVTFTPAADSRAAMPQFVDGGHDGGPYFAQPTVGRGAAAGDLDNDGDSDLVISHWGRASGVLRNDTGGAGEARVSRRHWIRLRLVGTTSNRDAVGAAVVLVTSAQRIHRQLIGGGSYLSSSERRLRVGLGRADRVERLSVRWPSGRVEHWDDLAADRDLVLVEGTRKGDSDR